MVLGLPLARSPRASSTRDLPSHALKSWCMARAARLGPCHYRQLWCACEWRRPGRHPTRGRSWTSNSRCSGPLLDGNGVEKSAAAPIPTSSEATEPVPFTDMPLGWERALGGPGYAQNPLGRGIGRVETSDGIHRIPLPNVELPSKLLTSSSQRPGPAGFGPLDVAGRSGCPSQILRRQMARGGLPGLRARHQSGVLQHGAARPADRRLLSRGRGCVLDNMHPSRSALRGRLPGAAARVLVRRKGSQDVEDVKMRLDTVVFLPGKEIGILIFRGVTPVLEDDASDIAVALVACEDLDAPRPTEHYAAALERRLDEAEPAPGPQRGRPLALVRRWRRHGGAARQARGSGRRNTARGFARGRWRASGNSSSKGASIIRTR